MIPEELRHLTDNIQDVKDEQGQDETSSNVPPRVPDEIIIFILRAVPLDTQDQSVGSNVHNLPYSVECRTTRHVLAVPPVLDDRLAAVRLQHVAAFALHDCQEQPEFVVDLCHTRPEEASLDDVGVPGLVLWHEVIQELLERGQTNRSSFLPRLNGMLLAKQLLKDALMRARGRAERSVVLHLPASPYSKTEGASFHSLLQAERPVPQRLRRLSLK
mmetsp:Transcript_43938/g.116140  ORF Transcript_43938/g.116140 Transcript_43938/m.116140 type:complete len:216 (-) Transcript_43938:1263-1910(-)